MATVVLTIHLLVAFALIIVVLLQRAEGGGLGIGGGGGGVVSGRGVATAMSKLTWILGIGFVCTSLALTVISARSSGVTSVIDSPATQTEDAPSVPGLGGDLLPPPLPSGPATPPAAD